MRLLLLLNVPRYTVLFVSYSLMGGREDVKGYAVARPSNHSQTLSSLFLLRWHCNCKHPIAIDIAVDGKGRQAFDRAGVDAQLDGWAIATLLLNQNAIGRLPIHFLHGVRDIPRGRDSGDTVLRCLR